MNIAKLSEEFVISLLRDKLPEPFYYHNIEHTVAVVNAVKQICENEKIDKAQRQVLLVAAWFHDTGYVDGEINHEESSISIAKDFLSKNEYDFASTNEVVGLIRATKFDYIPKTIAEKIICDADFSHVGSKDYLKISSLLREEWTVTQGKSYSDLEWLASNLEMLSKSHRYYTNYALVNWQPRKEKNLAKMLKQINALNETQSNETKKKEKEGRADKSIDTMYKMTITNHIRLSEIADSKANILLSVNAIIISIALSTLIPKLDGENNIHLILPTFILVISSVATIIFAILSTRPKVTSGKFTRQDIENKKVNLLFFGNFFKMPYDEYEWAMNELVKDKSYLYNSMTRDLYFLGLVLARKYRLLRITYNLFMAGLVVSVIAFTLSFT